VTTFIEDFVEGMRDDTVLGRSDDMKLSNMNHCIE
jgi:hypothetical protein